MPLIWKTLKKSFIDSYDYLALTILSSSVPAGIALIFFSLMSIIGIARHLLIVIVGAIFLYIFLISPLIAGANYLARKIITHDEPVARDLFEGARLYMKSSWMLGLVQVFISSIFLVNIWFYFTHGGTVFQVIGVVFLYLLFFWMSSTMYHFPVLIEQQPGTFTIIKRGFLLMLDNIVFTGIVFFVIILLTCLCLATFAGIPLLYLGLVSMISTRSFRAILIRYEMLPPEKEPSKEDGKDY
ncbi:MAG: YesL family protein [Armatimonadota bacterium]